VGSDERVEVATAPARDLLAGLVDLDGAPRLGDLFVPAERGAVEEVLRQVLAGTAWRGELALLATDAVSRVVSASFEPVRERATDGPASGALVVLEDVHGSRGRARRLAERLTRLARIISELLAATDVESITSIFTGHMADAAGATVASLSLLEQPDRLTLVGIRGGRDGVASRWRTYPLTGTPAGDCVRSRGPVVLEGRERIRERYPDLETAADGERSIVCLPLLVGERVIGVVSLSFPGVRSFSAAELEFMGVMSDACAQALDRARALGEAADRATKLAFLADASAELSSSLDYEATLTRVARLAVPTFADWCSISLSTDGELRTLSVAHVDPDKVALARDFQERYPPDPSAAQGAYQVLRTGASELTPDVTDEMIDAVVRDAEHREAIRRLNIRSALSVPLKVGDRVLGVITWVAGDGGRRFGRDDVAFGEDLARRAAVAIENSRLHTDLREMAVRLQRAVLPSALPRLAGWETAAHYSPTGALDAGGDFYDVVPLSDGRVAFFVGDVMGRGVHAAAAMAQMRSSVRAFLAVDPDPTAVLTRLDQVFEAYQVDQLVTMLYGVVQPATDSVTLANAGHLPPVLVDASGTVRPVPVRGDLLLGAGGTRRRAVTSPFRAGQTLLAFTDGLVERRDEDIDSGQSRLHRAATSLGTEPLEQALLRMVDEVADPNRDDDVAVLALRRTLVAEAATQAGFHTARA
jgi:GAF domain-containing protein